MPPESEMKAKAAKFIEQIMPSADVVRVSAQPVADSHGEKSLSIRVVVRERPASEESARLVAVVDKFRTWLVSRNDDRFPYFRLLSEREEQEIGQEAF
jgi:hypothetical protein